ncbi:Met18p [Saccharomyces eubayanus]|uniref:Met18p n=1 Tax=Saccharomyces eubayanus TaxID=1080349 RepID=UPI0006BF8E95|nr:MET18-like protein [Saccharomyces eubayanus]KOG98776.1 MET18-like protein [Saccharomyces eubayanus]
MTPDELNSAIVTFMANLNIDDSKANDTATVVTESIVHRSTKLLEVVVALKEYLLSENELERKNALTCLSTILVKIPKDHLSKNECSVIFQFYQSKFDDQALVKEVLEGFAALALMKFVSINEITQLLRLLLDNYQQGQHLASVRLLPFEVLKNIFDRFFVNASSIGQVKRINDLFIETFLHIANGEKDPKNLLLSFALNQSITSNLQNVANFKEDLFDVLFCYFPITFKPPKHDPYKISNQDLKAALRSAIVATPLFAEDAYSNLLDKLTASSPLVKNDTLLTLLECIRKFGGSSILENWKLLWNALKFEIMQNSEGGENTLLNLHNQEKSNDMGEYTNYEACLKIVSLMGLQLYDFDKVSFEKFFNHILDELKPNFRYEKDLKQTCQILSAIGSGKLEIFNEVISSTFPLFLNNTSETAKLKLLIMNLSFFFDSYIELFGKISTDLPEKSVPNNKLDEYKDEIIMILSMALTGSSKSEVTVRTLSVIQFTKMIKMRGFLTKEEVSLIIQYFTETVLTDSNKNIYYACLEGLKTISEIYESLVFEISLKRLLDLLPDYFGENIRVNDEENIQIETILKIILDFTTSRHILVKESISSLATNLNTVAKISKSKEYCFLLISTIYSLFNNNQNGNVIKEEDALSLKRAIEPKLFEIITQNSAVRDDNYNLTLLSNVLFFINLKLPQGIHQEELDKYNSIFISEGNIKILNAPTLLIIPYVKILSAMNKTCIFPQKLNILTETIQLLRTHGSIMTETEKLGYLELLLVLSNKYVPEKNVIELLDWNDLSLINLEIMIWLSKGLVMQNSSKSSETANKFIGLLSNEEIGSFVARLFEIFVVNISSLQKFKGINWNNNVKILYKQKFFGDIFQTLVNNYKTTVDMNVKCNYLTALSLVLKHTPSQLVGPFISDLFPLLLQALDMPDSEVRVSALETLKDTTDKHHKLITEHISTIVPLLLSLVLPQKYNNVNVRLIALQLLQMITIVVPLNYCLTYQDEVISGLVPVLSDKKRIVRKQCIDTRQVYFELGQVPFE